MTARLLSLQDPATARAHHAAGHWQGATLYALLHARARAAPTAPMLWDAGGCTGYGAMLGWVDGLAAHLHAAGLRPGDRVAIWAPARLESAATLLACSRMGYVAVPSLHRDHHGADVLALLRRTRAAAFLHQTGHGEAAETVAADAATLPDMRCVLRLAPPGPEPTERFGGQVAPAPAAPPPPAGDPDRISYLAFTSGTTGAPKGVMHSDNTLLANGRALVADFGFDAATVVYSFSPMSHNMGTVSLVTALACGGALALHGPGPAEATLERLERTGATYLVGVPTHAHDLLAGLPESRHLGRARLFQLAGAPVPVRLAEALIARGVQVQNCYGMTENCSFLYTRAADPVAVVTETCGRPARGMDIAVVDPEDPDRPLPPGRTGELVVRGASQMLGYFDDQTATEDSHTRAGWFRTGDLGLIDAAGNTRVMGRRKDIVRRGGVTLHPARLEDLVQRHPAIGRAAAFAVPDARLGERMCLAVVRSPGHPLPEPQALLAHLAAAGLPRAEMPEYLIELEHFPLTASGKILKRALAAEAAAGRLRPTPVRWRPDG